MNVIPSATSLESAQNLMYRYWQGSGKPHYIVLGEAGTYYVCTLREAKKLIEAGFELWEK